MASRKSGARNDSAPLEPRSWSQEWIAPGDEPELPRTRGKGGSGKAAPGDSKQGAPATASTPETPAPSAPRRKRAATKPITPIATELDPAAKPAPGVITAAVASARLAMPVIPVAAQPPPVPAQEPPVPALEPPVPAVTPVHIAAAAAYPPAAATPASGRSSAWVPVVAMAVASVLMVGLLVVAARAVFSATQGSGQLPGSPGTPVWVVGAATLFAAGAAVIVRRLGARGEQTGTSVQRHNAWLRLLDSRVIGTALALVLLVIAAELLRTPGASADIRELPGQVSGAIQSVVAQPETGYPRIRIKRVGIDLLLVKGDGKTPPVKYEAFTYPRADHVLAEQGTTGNTYVYAHARSGMFWNLHDVNIGDTIEIDHGAGKIDRYRVSEIHKSVSWKDFEWLQPTSDDRVTLQTCNGWRDEDPRYVVVAHRVPDTYTALAR